MHPFFVFPDHLSPTQAATFRRCPRRWYFRRMGLESLGPKPALVYGEAFHHAAGFAATGRLPEALAAFGKVWDESLADKKRSSGRAFAMIKDFSESHSGDRSLYKLVPPPTGVRVPERVSEWEVPFAVDVGLPVPVVGRIDGVGRHRDTGELWAVEFKTTTQLGAQFLAQFSLDPQILTYALALASYSSEPVKGTIVDGVLVAGTKVESLSLPIYVREHSLRDVAEWYKDIWEDILLCQERDCFPKWVSGCAPYASFGQNGFVCEYQPLCLAGPAWEEMLGLFSHEVPRQFEILETEVES